MEDIMTTNDEITLERELEIMHTEYLERRSEKDLQASIRLENLATFTMFKLSEGGE